MSVQMNVPPKNGQFQDIFASFVYIYAYMLCNEKVNNTFFVYSGSAIVAFYKIFVLLNTEN
jgi:hypothetical protein